jgi:NTP pyrophosphatase (non-canonical NTP hydrolase)
MTNTNELFNNFVPMYLRKIAQWHHDRNLINGATNQSQFVKLISEAGELADNVAKNKDCRDDIGDMIVVLINIAERNGYTIQECLEQAWNDIKDRKGKMVNGVFVKEQDADYAQCTDTQGV